MLQCDLTQFSIDSDPNDPLAPTMSVVQDEDGNYFPLDACEDGLPNTPLTSIQVSPCDDITEIGVCQICIPDPCSEAVPVYFIPNNPTQNGN